MGGTTRRVVLEELLLGRLIFMVKNHGCFTGLLATCPMHSLCKKWWKWKGWNNYDSNLLELQSLLDSCTISDGQFSTHSIIIQNVSNSSGLRWRQCTAPVLSTVRSWTVPRLCTLSVPLSCEWLEDRPSVRLYNFLLDEQSVWLYNFLTTGWKHVVVYVVMIGNLLIEWNLKDEEVCWGVVEERS